MTTVMFSNTVLVIRLMSMRLIGLGLLCQIITMDGIRILCRTQKAKYLSTIRGGNRCWWWWWWMMDDGWFTYRWKRGRRCWRWRRWLYKCVKASIVTRLTLSSVRRSKACWFCFTVGTILMGICNVLIAANGARSWWGRAWFIWPRKHCV